MSWVSNIVKNDHSKLYKSKFIDFCINSKFNYCKKLKSPENLKGIKNQIRNFFARVRC